MRSWVAAAVASALQDSNAIRCRWDPCRYIHASEGSVSAPCADSPSFEHPPTGDGRGVWPHPAGMCQDRELSRREAISHALFGLRIIDRRVCLIVRAMTKSAAPFRGGRSRECNRTTGNFGKTGQAATSSNQFSDWRQHLGHWNF